MKLFSLLLLIVLVATPMMTVQADIVADWNLLANQTSGQNSPARFPTQTFRILAMTHIAIHDALNAIDRRYEHYAYAGPGDPNASAAAAVASAAYNVLRFENPNTVPDPLRLQNAYNAALATIPDGPAKTAGIAIGEASAAAIRALRSGDGSTAPCPPWVDGTAAGEWRPTGSGNFATPCWGDVIPFTMTAGDRWRRPIVPSINMSNPKYTKEFNEVKNYGGAISALRTTDQAEAARFWYPSVTTTYGRMANIVGTQRGIDLWESARLFAIMTAASADAGIAVWDGKRAYPFWRPVTAIREAEHDGNPQTLDDDQWTSYMVTPPYPDYPSGHAGQDGAAGEVLRRFFGSDEISVTLSTTLPNNPPVSRTFTSFTGAARDGAESRIWGGLHFRTACEDALKIGERIGRQAYNHYFRPVSN